MWDSDRYNIPNAILWLRKLKDNYEQGRKHRIGLFDRRLCGIVITSEFAEVEGISRCLYLVRSDEHEDDPLDPDSRVMYHVAGPMIAAEQLSPGDRIHAAISRKEYHASNGVMAHLIRWHELVENPHKKTY